MVIKNKFFLNIIVFILLCKNVVSSQIYDYQTEEFITKIKAEILSVNNYKEKINFKIIKDDFPNAFVTENNNIFISSGLLIRSPDYISLLAVIAHEIGHVEKYHITKRKSEIGDLKKINSLSNLAIIAGSMLIKEPELIKALAVNKTAIDNLFINFSQTQEKEADLYAVNTLEKLKLSTESVKKFLIILENETKFDLIDEELRKFSTHPLFEERYDILESKEKKNLKNFDQNLQKEFNFIKAKFTAYTDKEISNELNGDDLIYYEAIKSSMSGNLLESMKGLNILISKNKDNFFFIETKADILLSYGYNKEAIQFYKKVLKKYPNNNYIKFNIFINSNYDEKDKDLIKDIFFKNQVLINLFPNNIALQTKLYNFSQVLQFEEWIKFFNILLNKNNNLKKSLLDLKQGTKDINLKKIINLYI